MGTDDSDDTWYDGDSPDLLRTEAGEMNRGAFQSEELDMSLTDDEMLEALRREVGAESIVGEVDEAGKQLVKVTYDCWQAAIEACRSFA